jgi:uncharacterized protein (TIGR03435 family)
VPAVSADDTKAVVFSALLQAQSVLLSATPKFDVVSIKRCQGFASRGGDSSPGRLGIGCGLLADVDNTGLIQVAYNRYASGHLTSVQVIPIEGGPDWIHSERFEIEAKADGHPSIMMMEGPMMQAALEDRFSLKIHRKSRQGPVYELAFGQRLSQVETSPGWKLHTRVRRPSFAGSALWPALL